MCSSRMRCTRGGRSEGYETTLGPGSVAIAVALNVAAPISVTSTKAATNPNIGMRNLFRRIAEAIAATTTTVPSKLRSKAANASRSEEHTSELQSRENLVCRLLLEKKKHDI